MVPELYNLIPPLNLTSSGMLTWVKDQASMLLKGAKFLQGLPNDNVCDLTSAILFRIHNLTRVTRPTLLTMLFIGSLSHFTMVEVISFLG
jgi:hypothetical protein